MEWWTVLRLLAFFAVVTLATARPRVHWNPEYDHDEGYRRHYDRDKLYTSAREQRFDGRNIRDQANRALYQTDDEWNEIDSLIHELEELVQGSNDLTESPATDEPSDSPATDEPSDSTESPITEESSGSYESPTTERTFWISSVNHLPPEEPSGSGESPTIEESSGSAQSPTTEEPSRSVGALFTEEPSESAE